MRVSVVIAVGIELRIKYKPNWVINISRNQMNCPAQSAKCFKT